MIKWPNEEEKERTSRYVKRLAGFPRCVGFIYGTLLPLENKPMLCGEDYYCRKGFYAVSATIIVDDTASIRYINAR